MNNPNYIPQAGWPIYLSLLAALLAGLFPLSGWLKDFMPNMVLLVIVYWALYRPDTIGMGKAWLVGLIQDVLMVNLIGQHALIYVVVVFMIKFASVNNKNHAFFEYMTWLVGFVVLDVVFVLIVNLVLYQSAVQWSIFYSVIGSILIWPWLYVLLNIFEAIAAEVQHKH